MLALVAAPLVALVLAPAATAHDNPPGCVPAEPKVSFADETLAQTDTPVRPGDSIELGVAIANPGPGTCFISDISVAILLPEPDGTPGEPRDIGSKTGLASGVSGKAFPVTDPYIVDLNQGVFEAPLGLRWEATIHSGDRDLRVSGDGAGTKVTLTRPRVDLTVVPSRPEGPSPLETTYVYLLTNDSPAPTTGLPAPSLVASGPTGPRDALSDENCEPLIFISGDDTDGPPALLSPGETWKFHCTRFHLVPGDYLSRPTVTGTSDIDGRPWPQPPTGNLHSPVRVYGPDVVVDKSHAGDFLADSPGEYRLSVTNVGNLATSGEVELIDRLPAGLTATSISGVGWDCELSTLRCTRSDSLPSGASYPDVVLAVRTAPRPPAHVDNVAIVSGGGEPPGADSGNTDTDRTRIRNPAQPVAPARAFRVVKVSSRADGTAVLTLRVPRPGRVIVDDARRPDLLKRTSKKARKAGRLSVRVKPGRKLRRQLIRGGKPRKVRVQATFLPRRGLGHTEVIVRRVTLAVARKPR